MGPIPTVSIGLPVYNGAEYLTQTLDTLLKQSFRDFEIIISDNASTDATQEICTQYQELDPRIKYYRVDENKGAAWNFNRVFQLARGKYFKWAAHDDLILPTFLERCVEVLDNSPDVVLVFTKLDIIDAQGKKVDTYENSIKYRFYQFAAALS